MTEYKIILNMDSCTLIDEFYSGLQNAYFHLIMKIQQEQNYLLSMK